MGIISCRYRRKSRKADWAGAAQSQITGRDAAPRNCAPSMTGAGCDGSRRRLGNRSRMALIEQLISTLAMNRSEEHTSELQSQSNLVCRLLLEKKKKTK